MNRKTLYLNLLVTSLLLGAGTAQAARMPLADAIHVQMRQASANIQADIAATVKEQPRILDVPGVEIGEIQVVETTESKEQPRVRTQASPETAGLDATLRRDLLIKALHAPGMFGVYRYLAVPASTTAVLAE
ncbi:MAG TPA: hypothetical protein VF267_10870 [Gammaproteobacteria bacterium]